MGNSPVTDEFPAQRVSNAENVSIWWLHHVLWYSIDTKYVNYITWLCRTASPYHWILPKLHIKWRHTMETHYWPFVKRVHWSLADSPQKGASNAELCCFLGCQPEQIEGQPVQRLVNLGVLTSLQWRHSNELYEYPFTDLRHIIIQFRRSTMVMLFDMTTDPIDFLVSYFSRSKMKSLEMETSKLTYTEGL